MTDYQRFDCYTDASYTDGQLAGYGIVIVKTLFGRKRLFHVCSGLVEVASSLEAELFGILKALQLVPSEVFGEIHSDLQGIYQLLDGKPSGSKSRRAILHQIKEEIKRTGLTVTYQTRKLRSHHYVRCHEMANRERIAVRLESLTSRINRSVKLRGGIG